MFRRVHEEGGAERSIAISVDGQIVTAREGEPLAAVLLRTPPHISRVTPVLGKARAPFCMMGVCFDCLVDVNGQSSLRSCLIRVSSGMAVKRSQGRPSPILGAQS